MIRPETLKFLEQLSQNNRREWFHAQKAYYDSVVKPNSIAFCQELIDQFLGEEAFKRNILPKDCMFRIHRDIRFSKDKTPYKTHFSYGISSYGKKAMHIPAAYIELSSSYMRLYSGVYSPDKEQLLSIREHIASDPEQFMALISDPLFTAQFGQVLGEKNKRLVEPFKSLEPSIPLIANKQFYYYKTYQRKEILSDDIVSVLKKDFSILTPLNQFLYAS